MNEYSDFAYIYDKLTFDVDYEGYADFIEQIFKNNNIKPELIADLACGTGNMQCILSDRGYDVIGIDNSVEMLEVAREKCNGALLLNQDITEFELYGTVDCVLCLLDSVNYITDKTKLKKMFSLVHNYLNPNGLFIFDINSEFKLKNILGNNTFVYETDDVFYTWENELINNKINFYLNFFVLNDDDKYTRIEETHTERLYKQNEIEQLLSETGFEQLETYADFKFKIPVANSERIIFSAKK